MKKLKTLLLLAAAMLFFGNSAFSQPGSSCATPYVITALPFTQAGMTTNGFPDIFDNSSACNSTYMTGNDFIFTYTPAFTQYVNIALTNTGFATGLFIVDSCPSLAGANCVASAEAITGNPSLSNVNLNGGTTYYIIVSTWDPGFPPNPSTAFDIQMDMINPYDLSVASIINPVSGCALTAAENITINIANNGIAAVDSFMVEYTIDGGTPIIDTVFDEILPGGNLTFTFTVPGNFSTPNTTYNLVVYTDYADSNPLNDTASVSITNAPVISVYPYYEDFEADNGGYGSSGTSSSWAWGTPAKPIITHASSPTKCWVTSLTGNYNQGEASYLDFPCLDFSSLTAPVLEFDIWMATSGILDYCRVEYSKDGGASWAVLGGQNDPVNWYDGTNGWSSAQAGFMTVRHRVDSLAGNASAKLRIYFYGSLISQTDGVAIDDIKIYQAPANDLAVTQILYPGTSCGLTNNEYMQVTIENLGTAPQTNFAVGYAINGVNSTPETVSATLNPGASMQYTYTTPANLSITQQYQIKCYSGLIADADLTNDTASVTINNLLGISAFPYNENFETSNGGWVGGGLNSSWAWGEPVKPTINHAASPTKCWVTNLTTNANMMEMSNLTGPCFDFTTLTAPEIEFNIWYATSSMAPGMDSIVLQVSVDSGSTWKSVGHLGDGFNWYNTDYGWSGNSGTWLHTRHTLDSAGGKQNVRIRISYYGPYASVCEGMAIDDIYIHEAQANDLGMLEINAPSSNCNLSTDEYVGILFTNYGQNSQNYFPLSYQINNGPWNSDTIMFDIYYGESIYWVFSQTADLSALGTYVIRATTGLINDGDHTNDTIVKVVENASAISTLPYTEDFESSDGDWYTEGTSSWAWGVPASTIINTAHSPSHAWKTNLTGNAIAGEESYLYSPCMDFTNYDNPFIELYVWHETTPMMGSSAVLEASYDGGLSWNIIGPNDINNWYQTNLSGGNSWTGSSAGWVFKTHALNFCANQPGVKLRIHYMPGQFSMVPEEGIAIDDIHIYECVLPESGFTYAANGATIDFTNSSSGATSYVWSFGDGTNGTSANISHTYAVSGNYTVSLVATNDCGSDTTSQTISVTVDGIDDHSIDNSISCSPNPGNGIFNLVINSSVSAKTDLTIYNLTGSLIYQETIDGHSGKLVKQIDISTFGKGVYYLHLNGKDINSVRKIVVE